MDSSDKMLARKEGRVGTMIFNNPERHNAVSLEMWQAAARILDDFARDGEIRVVILAGAGGKSFVSGADISKFEDEPSQTNLRGSKRTPEILPRMASSGMSREKAPMVAPSFGATA